MEQALNILKNIDYERLAIGLAVLYDRLVLKKKKTVYTIIGFAQQDP